MDRPLKILIIHPEIPLKRGGAEAFTLELAHALSKEGHKVHILCYPGGKSRVSINGDLRILPLLKKRLRLVLNPWIVLKLALKNKYDVIHAQFAYPAGMWALTVKLLRKPILVTSHGWDLRAEYGALGNRLIALITRIVLKIIDAHVLVSKSMLKDAIKAGASLSKIVIIHNGIDISKLRKKVNEPEILRQYSISDEETVILYLGRLHPLKCVGNLIKAFRKIVHTIPRAKLVISGKGSEFRKLKELTVELGIENKVVFTGFVFGEEKISLLKRCDIFVLPSKKEGQPLAVIEAMAFGKPVIIPYNIDHFSETIRQGVTGVIIPDNSPESLANAIIDLALNPRKRALIGARAMEEANKRFDIKNTVNKYLKLYSKLAHQKV